MSNNGVSARSASNASNASNAKCNSLESHLEIATAPPIPGRVYDNLPATISTRSKLIEERHRRDIFTIASLPTISCQMPNVSAAHRDKYYSPDNMVMIVAPTGSGKGEADKATRLCFKTDNWIREQSEKEIQEYESESEEEKKYLERPERKSLVIPANTSSRMMLNRLKANNGAGFIVESEIDTLINTAKQEWGNYTDSMRKAFHHESISIMRTDDEYYIKHPRLSVLLTGTNDQFKNMFQGAENGHFSRYGLFTVNTARTWESHRPTEKTHALNDSLDAASDTLLEMYKILKGRNEPLFIDLTAEQWDAIDDTFRKKMELIEGYDLSAEIHSSNQRTAIITLRLISLFTVLRTFEDNPEILKTRSSLTPTDQDMIAGLSIGDVFIKHAIRLYHILPKADSDPKGKRYKQFVDILPKKFETVDALLVAEELEIPERTVKHWLSNMDEFERIKRGHYRKM